MTRPTRLQQRIFDIVFMILEAEFREHGIRVNDGEELEVRGGAGERNIIIEFRNVRRDVP